MLSLSHEIEINDGCGLESVLALTHRLHVLVGIRTAVKDDLKCSTAEMVYRSTLRLLIPTQAGTFADPLLYVDTL